MTMRHSAYTFPMRVVVTGGTGFLGRPLVAHLAASGDDVAVLTRTPRGLSGVREVEWRPDGSVGAWAAALDGADAVVHLAGESIGDRRWTPARKAALVESRTLSAKSLVGALDELAARPALLISSSGVDYYADSGDAEITEDAPAGHDFLARLCVEWEQAARRAEGLGVRVVTTRSGLILASDGGALAKMLLPFRLGVGGALGRGLQYWPWIHRDDWIRIVAFLLRHPSASGPVNLTAPAPVTNREFSHVLARTLRRPCLVPVPAFALRLLLGELADVVLASHRVVPARLLAMGYRFKYVDLASALRDVLA
jgi:uncharacterized protein (TIGR01777 family)